MRAATIGAAVILATGLWTTAAAADETTAAKPAGEKTGVYTLEKIKIVARAPRPAVAVDVARIVQRAPLPDLRQPLVDRIGKAVEKAPF